jgi:hypothetical protein
MIFLVGAISGHSRGFMGLPPLPHKKPSTPFIDEKQ